jgi:hypothetical protein
MAKIPTVRVNDGKGGYYTINEADFNPAVHEGWQPNPAPAKKAAAKKAKKARSRN